MKKLLTALAIASFALCHTVQAQPADPKLEWAKRVAVQQGPELERLVRQLAEGSAQDVLQTWGPKLQSEVPKARLQQATDELNVELKKYFDDINKVITGKVNKSSTDALIPAYMERFTLDELKQLAAFFESPAIKKYQSAAPELGNIFVKQLIESSRADVLTRGKQFDDAATKIVGSSPKSGSTVPWSAPRGTRPTASTSPARHARDATGSR